MNDNKELQNIIYKLHLLLATTDEEYNSNPEFFIRESEKALEEYKNILLTKES